MRRLIWVFAGRTSLIVGFVLRWLSHYYYKSVPCFSCCATMIKCITWQSSKTIKLIKLSFCLLIIRKPYDLLSTLCGFITNTFYSNTAYEIKSGKGPAANIENPNHFFPFKAKSRSQQALIWEIWIECFIGEVELAYRRKCWEPKINHDGKHSLNVETNASFF